VAVAQDVFSHCFDITCEGYCVFFATLLLR